MSITSKLASNMKYQVLKQYKLNNINRELKKKDSKITSVIYYNNEGVLVGYNNGKLKTASSLSAAKAGNLTETTIKQDGDKLSEIQINNMNRAYRKIWQYEGETYGVKPGRVDRLENGGGDITNIDDVKGWDPEYEAKLEVFDILNCKIDNVDPSKYLHIQTLNAWRNNNYEIHITKNNARSWDSLIDSDFTYKTGFEIYINTDPDYNFTNKFQSTFFNEKRYNMKNIFHMPISYNYDKVDKSKRMEFGYYNMNTSRFISYYNNQIIKNIKSVNKIKNNKIDRYLVKYNGSYSTNYPSFTTFGKFITYLSKNVKYYSSSGVNSLNFRYYVSIDDNLSGNDDNLFIYKFIPGNDTNYTGGGI